MIPFFCIFTTYNLINSMNDALNIIAKNHLEWVRMVNNFGCFDAAEDIVQDAYLRVYEYSKPEKVLTNNKPNRAFMFVVLRNSYIQHCKDKKKLQKVCLSNTKELSSNYKPLERKIAQSAIDEKINEIQEEWHWYDKLLFNYYRESGKSLRKIAFETGISVTSLWNTIKNCKQRLKEELQEDYQDFINEDYELL